MSMFTLYLLLVLLPNINNLSDGFWAFLVGVGFILSSIGYAICFCCAEIDGDKQAKAALPGLKKTVRGFGYALGLICLLGAITPSDKQLYKVVGAYAVTNIDGIKELPENIVGAANSYLKDIAAAVKAEEPKESPKQSSDNT